MTIQESLELAMQHHRSGQLAEAEALYNQILAGDPRQPEALHYLGVVAYQRNELEAARELIGRAIAIKSDSPEYHSNLGAVLEKLRLVPDAIASYRRAIELNPNYAEAHFNLGNMLRLLGKLDEAVACYRRALALRPDYVDACLNLGSALKFMGLIPQAIQCYQQILAALPNAWHVHSNLIYDLHLLPQSTPAQLLESHRQWDSRHAAHLKSMWAPHANDRSPDRPLRIGYVSPDFRLHSVMFFLLPVLRHRDRANFHITAYPTADNADALTPEVRRQCDAWRPLANLSDDQAAAQIRDDRIDILVDLAGHTADHRLLVFARKPAPVQATWLGYPNTTGLSAIDWRLTDSFADPADRTPPADAFSVERLLRLPRCAWCFEPLSGSPPTDAALRSTINFGCFGEMGKMNPQLLELWAKILRQLPNSLLVIKNRGSSSLAVHSRLQKIFGSDRLLFLPRPPDPLAHLSAYQHIDIALDTFPYHGTTTTCEALWMGVPVITRAGSAHHSRVGVSLLHNVGLADLVAQSEEEYVDLALTLARDASRRRHLRAHLRQQMQSSPLMEGARMACDLQTAFRTIWTRYLA